MPARGAYLHVRSAQEFVAAVVRSAVAGRSVDVVILTPESLMIVAVDLEQALRTTPSALIEPSSSDEGESVRSAQIGDGRVSWNVRAVNERGGWLPTGALMATASCAHPTARTENVMFWSTQPTDAVEPSWLPPITADADSPSQGTAAAKDVDDDAVLEARPIKERPTTAALSRRSRRRSEAVPSSNPPRAAVARASSSSSCGACIRKTLVWALLALFIVYVITVWLLDPHDYASMRAASYASKRSRSSER